MEVPVPSLDSIKSVWDWTLQQLTSWFKVLNDPVAVLKELDLDSSESTIKAFQFAAFPIVLGPALMAPVALLVDDRKSSLGIVGYFATNVILNVLLAGMATFGQRLGSKLVRGKGSVNACAVSTLYGAAYWPIFVINAYVNANYRGALHPKDPHHPDPALLIIIIAALATAVYVLRKYVPMMMYVHQVGRFRGYLICLITGLTTVILGSIMSSSFAVKLAM